MLTFATLPFAALLAVAAPSVTFGSGAPIVGETCTETTSMEIHLQVPPALAAFPARGIARRVTRSTTLGFDEARDLERQQVTYVRDEMVRGDVTTTSPVAGRTFIVERERDAHRFFDADGATPVEDEPALALLRERFGGGPGERALLQRKTFALGDVIEVDADEAQRVWGNALGGLRVRASRVKIGMIGSKGARARIDYRIPLVVEGARGDGEALATGSVLFDVATLRAIHTSMEGPVRVDLGENAAGIGPPRAPGAGRPPRSPGDIPGPPRSPGDTPGPPRSPSVPVLKGTFSAVEDAVCAVPSVVTPATP